MEATLAHCAGVWAPSGQPLPLAHALRGFLIFTHSMTRPVPSQTQHLHTLPNSGTHSLTHPFSHSLAHPGPSEVAPLVPPSLLGARGGCANGRGAGFRAASTSRNAECMSVHAPCCAPSSGGGQWACELTPLTVLTPAHLYWDISIVLLPWCKHAQAKVRQVIQKKCIRTSKQR